MCHTYRAQRHARRREHTRRPAPPLCSTCARAQLTLTGARVRAGASVGIWTYIDGGARDTAHPWAGHTRLLCHIVGRLALKTRTGEADRGDDAVSWAEEHRAPAVVVAHVVEFVLLVRAISAARLGSARGRGAVVLVKAGHHTRLVDPHGRHGLVWLLGKRGGAVDPSNLPVGERETRAHKRDTHAHTVSAFER